VRIGFLCFRLFVMSLNWVVITMCFYGLSLNSANNEDFFGSLAAMSTAEVPAYIAAMFVMEAFGRRSVLAFCQVQFFVPLITFLAHCTVQGNKWVNFYCTQ
jgi:hypothetical protein